MARQVPEEQDGRTDLRRRCQWRGSHTLRPHGPRGHWHKGGYDKLGAGGSHTEFPDDVRDIQGQIAWALDQIKNTGADMLVEAGFPDAAKSLDQEMVGAASEAIVNHLAEQGDLIAKAIDEGLIAA